MDKASLDTLLKTQSAVWRGRDRYASAAGIPTGFATLNQALPANGWGVGGVTELLLDQHGIGELSLLLPGLRYITDTGWAALINPPYVPYAPAFSNAGIALERLLIINSGDDINTLWAAEQVLRSGLFGAVVSWVQKSSAQRQRRLQLAAETGNSWATVYRPLQAGNEHSPVATRISLSLQQNTSAGLDQQSLHQLILDITKVRAGSPQRVIIGAEEFDASQGAEWPVMRVQARLRSLSDVASRISSSTSSKRTDDMDSSISTDINTNSR
jgi:cell division inhibitor SulA/protein ImuA